MPKLTESIPAVNSSVVNPMTCFDSKVVCFSKEFKKFPGQNEWLPLDSEELFSGKLCRTSSINP